jgi:aspartyl-tRNA(Asn)/glutamyl-tRNA(Gln) amidotransferase subunit A
MLGTYSSSAGYADKYFEKAARVRTLVIRDFSEAFEKVDVIISPVSASMPFKIGEEVTDPLRLYLMDLLTIPSSLAGLPGLAIPVGFSEENLPIGMQIIGPRWSEEKLFTVGEQYQSITNWHKKSPKK